MTKLQLQYDLTQQQAKELGSIVEELGFEYAPFGLTYHNILHRNPTEEGNIMVGQVENAGTLGTKLEIYDYHGLPDEIRGKVDKLLDKYGFEKPGLSTE